MKRILKSMVIYVICFLMLCTASAFAVTPEIAIWEASSRIMISGQTDAALAGQNATIMLLDKEANPEDIQVTDVGYIGQVKIMEGGFYKFVTTIPKSASNYSLRLRVADEDITRSVISATTDDNMISTSFDVDRGLTSADINVAFTNELLVEGETYTIITAYYDVYGRMLTAQATQTANISATDMVSKITASTTYVDGAKTLKVFIWDSTENVIPLCDSEEIEIEAPLTVACWGDSLTEGYGGDGVTYPSELAKLTNYTVYNMGVGGETAYTIAARQGAHKIVTKEAFVIPASASAVQFEFETEEGGIIVPRSHTRGGWSPCTIAGVEGNLSIEVNTDVNPRELKWIKFTRTEAGESVIVPAGTQIELSSHEINADINIFFTGTNGGWTKDNLKGDDNSDEMCQLFCELLQKQIVHTGKSKYIVVGLTDGASYSYDNLTKHQKEYFGDNFLDLRSYLISEQAFADAGIAEISDSDRARMSEGRIPMAFLLSAEDTTHFNATGYTLIAKRIYEKMQELDYCK